MKLENGYERLPRNYALATDEYEFTMSSSYLDCNKEKEIAVFDVFFRKVPNNGGYAIMAGLDKVIPYIEQLRFGEKELAYFKKYNYPDRFIEYLRNFKFTGDIYAIPDGTPVFPNEPILTVKAPIIEAQIIETAILSMLNGAMEHATGARRIVEAVPQGVGVVDFGFRRADGIEAGIDSAIYAIMAGCVGTSNVLAADMLGIPAKGTHAHSYITSHDTEIEAYKNYALTHLENVTLLLDTYDTLRSGIVNAIKIFDYLKNNNIPYKKIGVRIDSGDLAYLSKEVRKALDEAGHTDASIFLTNSLDAETIESLTQQGAKFDFIGAGDNISKPEGRMGCVYKEVALIVDDKKIPKIKISNDPIKTVNPDFKRLYRAYDKETGYAIADIMARREEKVSMQDLKIISPMNQLKQTTINDFDLVELQKTIFKDGKLVYEDPTLWEKRDYCNQQMATIYPEVKRTRMPHEYYVDGTEEYVEFKNDLIVHTKKMQNI